MLTTDRTASETNARTTNHDHHEEITVFSKSHITWLTEREQRHVEPACRRPGHPYASDLASAFSLGNGGPPV